MSKGSKVRPKTISDDEFNQNWTKIFGKNGENPKNINGKKQNMATDFPKKVMIKKISLRNSNYPLFDRTLLLL